VRDVYDDALGAIYAGFRASCASNLRPTRGPPRRRAASLILKMWRARAMAVPGQHGRRREVLFYDTVAPPRRAGLLSALLRCGAVPANQGLATASGGTSPIVHHIATEWPLPPTEPQCRAIVGVLGCAISRRVGGRDAARRARSGPSPTWRWCATSIISLPGFWANFSDRHGRSPVGRSSPDPTSASFAAPPHFASRGPRART